METKIERNILIILLAFLGLSAIGGGGALIISPSGKLLGGLPLSILERSPFNNFLARYHFICRFGVYSLSPGICFDKKPENKYAEYLNFFKDMYWAWSFSIYVAFALIICIQVETIYVQGVGWL